MATENKNQHRENRPKSKITPMHSMHEPEDSAVDDMIRQSLKDEADEIERKLDENPYLSGITVSDSIYDKIVRQLKEDGVWEEEGPKEGEPEQDQPETDKPEERKPETAKPEKAIPEKRKPETAEPEKVIPEESGTKEEMHRESLESLYQKLPEEDHRAMELGHRIQARRKRKAARFRTCQCIARRGGIAAAVCVLVFGISMTSSANRRLIMKMWGAVVDSFGNRTLTDYVDEESSAQSSNEEELDAMEEISDQTGIPGIDFAYMPDDMAYLRFEVWDNDTEAKVFYSCGEEIVSLYMQNAQAEGINYYVADSDAAVLETLTLTQGTEVHISELDASGGSKRYKAEFQYRDCRYIISGSLPLDELENLLKNMVFLSKTP